jgi:hypothetical protein
LPQPCGDWQHPGIQDEPHHIFPKALIRRNPREMVDSIANKIPILKATNNGLSDTEPFQYFAKQLDTHKAAGTTGQFKERVENCLIPGDPNDPNWLQQFRIENFDKFLEDRATLILAQLKSIVGDALAYPSQMMTQQEVEAEE